MTTATHEDTSPSAADALLCQSHSQWADKDPERARLLGAVIRYRAAWRELAAALEDCDLRELWRRWGYASFEVYCKDELRLSKAIVTRYRKALAFLREAGAPDADAPLQGVEVAQQAVAAGEAGEIPADEAGELVERALSGNEGARQLAAELQEKRERRFEPRLFGGTGPDPRVLAKARKAMARLEVATQPLREQMPAHVLTALEVVNSYLRTAESPTVNPDAEPPAVVAQAVIKSAADAPAAPPVDEQERDSDPAAAEAAALPADKEALDLDPGTMESPADLPAAREQVADVTYEREDAGAGEATPQGQELLRRCRELLWLSKHAETADLSTVRDGLRSRLAQLSDEDSKALSGALGVQRWEELRAALGDSDAREVAYE